MRRNAAVDVDALVDYTDGLLDPSPNPLQAPTPDLFRDAGSESYGGGSYSPGIYSSQPAPSLSPRRPASLSSSLEQRRSVAVRQAARASAERRSAEQKQAVTEPSVFSGAPSPRHFPADGDDQEAGSGFYEPEAPSSQPPVPPPQQRQRHRGSSIEARGGSGGGRSPPLNCPASRGAAASASPPLSSPSRGIGGSGPPSTGGSPGGVTDASLGGTAGGMGDEAALRFQKARLSVLQQQVA